MVGIAVLWQTNGGVSTRAVRRLEGSTCQPCPILSSFVSAIFRSTLFALLSSSLASPWRLGGSIVYKEVTHAVGMGPASRRATLAGESGVYRWGDTADFCGVCRA